MVGRCRAQPVRLAVPGGGVSEPGLPGLHCSLAGSVLEGSVAAVAPPPQPPHPPAPSLGPPCHLCRSTSCPVYVAACMHGCISVHACMWVCVCVFNCMFHDDCASAVEAKMAITLQHRCPRCLVSLTSLDSAVQCLVDACDPSVQAMWLFTPYNPAGCLLWCVGSSHLLYAVHVCGIWFQQEGCACDAHAQSHLIL